MFVAYQLVERNKEIKPTIANFTIMFVIVKAGK